MRRITLALALVGLVALSGLSARPSFAATTLFGLVNTGELFASADDGVSWTPRSTLPVRDAVALAAGSTSSILYLASAGGSFYRSGDAGTNWSAVGTVEAHDVVTLVSSLGRILLLTERGSAYVSLDEGTTFAAVGTIAASDLVSATRADGIYFALARTGGVYRSLDNGVSWSPVGAVSTPNAVEIVAFEGDLYLITATGDLAKSLDSGATWSFTSTLSQIGTTALAATETHLVATTEGGETAISADGAGWTWQGAIGQLTVMALGHDLPTTIGVEPPPGAGATAAFHGAWPNPATGQTRLAFELAGPSVVSLEVFDARGRWTARPIDKAVLPAGLTILPWQPDRLAPGVYRLRAQLGTRNEARTFVWLGRSL